MTIYSSSGEESDNSFEHEMKSSDIGNKVLSSQNAGESSPDSEGKGSPAIKTALNEKEGRPLLGHILPHNEEIGDVQRESPLSPNEVVRNAFEQIQPHITHQTPSITTVEGHEAGGEHDIYKKDTPLTGGAIGYYHPSTGHFVYGGTSIDPRVPDTATLKGVKTADGTGTKDVTDDFRKGVAVHEKAEVQAMNQYLAGGETSAEAYKRAHNDVAIPAETHYVSNILAKEHGVDGKDLNDKYNKFWAEQVANVSAAHKGNEDKAQPHPWLYTHPYASNGTKEAIDKARLESAHADRTGLEQSMQTVGDKGSTLDSILNWFRGGPRSAEAATPKNVSSQQFTYPSIADAKFAQKYGFAYGKSWEDFFNDAKTRVMKKDPLATGTTDIDYITYEAAHPTTVGGPEAVRDLGLGGNMGAIKGEEIYPRAALAANRSAITSLGFDPAHVALDTYNKKATVAGVYNPNTDRIYSNMTQPESAIVHESTHRGIQKLRENVPEANEIMYQLRKNGVDEETLVRQVMRSKMGNIEEELHGSAGQEQINFAQFKFTPGYEGSSTAQENIELLEKLEKVAAQYIANKHPGGPR